MTGGKITRHSQTDFEESLKHAFLNKDVINAISEILIGSIIDKLREKFIFYDDKIACLEAEVEELKTMINKDSFKNSVDNQRTLEQKVDNVQQNQKINNLRLIGVVESKTEDLNKKVSDILKDKMNTNLNPTDLKAAYRVGQSKNGRPRHIIITFSDNKTKMDIYMKKKYLKGTGVIVKEDLIPSRLNAVQEASEKYGFKNVWTLNGIVFAKTNKGVQKYVPNNL